MHTYNNLNKLDKSFTHHVRKIEYRIKSLRNPNDTLFNNVIFPYHIIQLSNTWNNFIKNYIYSCIITTKSKNGISIRSNITKNINQGLGIVIVRYKRTAVAKPDGSWHRRDEPTWHDINVALTAANLLNLSNEQDIINAFSTRYRVFGDLTVFRNFYAHKNGQTEKAAHQLALYYGIPSNLRPSEILLSKATRRPQEIVYDWIDDLVFTANYLCH